MPKFILLLLRILNFPCAPGAAACVPSFCLQPSETAPQPSTGLGAYCACPKALRKAPWCYCRRLRVELVVFPAKLPRSQENLTPNCVLFIISSKAEAFPHRLPFEIFLWPAFVDPAGGSWGLPGVYPRSSGAAAIPLRPASCSLTDKDRASARTQLGRAV